MRNGRGRYGLSTHFGRKSKKHCIQKYSEEYFIAGIVRLIENYWKRTISLRSILVIVDLYPFEETVANGGSEEEIIEKIDIGGISLIRAAAKNYKDVLVAAFQTTLRIAVAIIERKTGRFGSPKIVDGLPKRRLPFSSQYDAAIFNYFR